MVPVVCSNENKIIGEIVAEVVKRTKRKTVSA